MKWEPELKGFPLRIYPEKYDYGCLKKNMLRVSCQGQPGLVRFSVRSSSLWLSCRYCKRHLGLRPHPGWQKRKGVCQAWAYCKPGRQDFHRFRRWGITSRNGGRKPCNGIHKWASLFLPLPVVNYQLKAYEKPALLSRIVEGRFDRICGKG